MNFLDKDGTTEVYRFLSTTERSTEQLVLLRIRKRAPEFPAMFAGAKLARSIICCISEINTGVSYIRFYIFGSNSLLNSQGINSLKKTTK